MWLEQRLDNPAGNNMTNRERLAENDQRYGREAKDVAKTRDERLAELRSHIAEAQNEIERLEREAAEEGNPNVAVTGDPAVGLVRDNTGVNGETPEGAPEGKETYENQTYWTVARLQEEIDTRNVDRKASGLEAMPRTGKRAELVERLMQDDEELENS